MLNLHSSSFLRRVLLADAAAGIATALPMLFGAELLAQWFGLPAALLREAGIILLPLAAFVAYVGMRAHLSRRLVWAVIICNVLWVIDSIILLMSGWVAPNALGQAFVIAQAMVVALLAELEYFGLRKTATALA